MWAPPIWTLGHAQPMPSNTILTGDCFACVLFYSRLARVWRPTLHGPLRSRATFCLGAMSEPSESLVPRCGDGNVDEGEACDDGNNEAGDGCDAECVIEPRCGDGNVDEGEECDDGNLEAGDGCDADCTVVPTQARRTYLRPSMRLR